MGTQTATSQPQSTNGPDQDNVSMANSTVTDTYANSDSDILEKRDKTEGNLWLGVSVAVYRLSRTSS